MAEGDNDFQVRIVPIVNGYLVKRQGLVWHFHNIAAAREKIASLIMEWKRELGPFQGDQ